MLIDTAGMAEIKRRNKQDLHGMPRSLSSLRAAEAGAIDVHMVRKILSCISVAVQKAANTAPDATLSSTSLYAQAYSGLVRPATAGKTTGIVTQAGVR